MKDGKDLSFPKDRRGRAGEPGFPANGRFIFSLLLKSRDIVYE